MDQVKSWATQELKNLSGFLAEDEAKGLIDVLATKSPAEINQELSNLLDFTQQQVKKFINSFLERIANQKNYEQQVKQLQQKTNKMSKDEVTGQRINTQKITKQVKDMSKFLVSGRQICYCQASRHNLINNCISCGKVVCEQEGEGPCLFCGAWVDREVYYDIDEDSATAYEIALQHKDKLIEFDVNAAQRLGVLDAQSDWYDLANNTWLNKEQRKYAEQMQEVEKKRQEEIDSKMNVTIDLQKGTTDLVSNEQDKLFTFGNQNIQTNEYLSKTTGVNKTQGSKYKPFEGEDLTNKLLLENPQMAIDNINTFYFKPCTLSDEKSQLLYQELQPSYMKEVQTNIVGSKVNKKAQQDREDNYQEEQRQKQIEESAKQKFQYSSLSKRLQTENPFDIFRKAVETAIISKSISTNKKVFETDKDFFKESEDIGMCMSMHQPWASLLVMGIKRFEGREWTHKFRGPLWIHATSQKPTQELIDQIEGSYREFYKSIGEDLPPFPDRYLTSVVIGRVDVIDIISLEEYHDQVPKELQEPTVSEYQFICRNPMYLDLPLKMSGQPGIYKMEKGIFYGCKELLIKTPVTWWPPEEFKLYNLGRFDLYPLKHQINPQDQIQKLPMKVSKTNLGCFHIQNLLSLREQQQILDSLRNQQINQPQKYKFTRSETLANEEEIKKEEDSFSYLQDEKNNFAQERNKKKFNCYVMELSGRDVTDEVKNLMNAVEDGVNQLKDQSQSTLVKSVYKRFTFDFFKESPDTYMEKIKLFLPQQKAKKKGKNQPLINAFFICVGDGIKIDYNIEEDSKSYNYSIELKSGDAFVVSSEVKGMQLSVEQIVEKTKPSNLVLRDGTLLITVERD
ncbi:activating signal cointegrator 1 [Stylonychia lemnae]|uniref:Activating signal cointegrator 1 n=1 Tax=Stylonychia lemnae TaxID=5949 RepID=A0A078ADJ5_STYLE|nr:activating signal cointegrator 1 [Stylonychia lemnae]|eukprot:CDW80309.1 activating signal cointegrator 1 [Stylonychia lemnae]